MRLYKLTINGSKIVSYCCVIGVVSTKDCGIDFFSASIKVDFFFLKKEIEEVTSVFFFFKFPNDFYLFVTSVSVYPISILNGTFRRTPAYERAQIHKHNK